LLYTALLVTRHFEPLQINLTMVKIGNGGSNASR